MKAWLAVALLASVLACRPAKRESSKPAETRGPSSVTFERLVSAESEPDNWLMYSGQYHGQRYSHLEQIHRGNVKRLQVKWVYQLRILGEAETSPLVVDGVMYLTSSSSDVIALDAGTGRPFWTYVHRLPGQLSLCCGAQNRGVAILGDRLFLGTLDARLVSLDAKTGNVIWDVKVADETAGYSKTAAPLVVKDKVIDGIAGGEFGIRGFIDAYDAKTGRRVWRFHTIPAPGEPGNETWKGDSWKTGGAPTWMTGSYDPELDLLYWGVGNPGPSWNGDSRAGDNLYSDSVVALDPDTGELKWHFQFTPHDVHDWDSAQVPVLVDGLWQGKPRKLLFFANRNGFFYVLDRRSGEFLLAHEFALQTWAERIDEKGRPVSKSGTLPSAEGTLVYPSANGAANWWSPSYSPKTRLFYLTAYDGAETYYTGEDVYTPGQMYVGSGPVQLVPGEKYVSAIRALDPLTGERKWEYRLQPRSTSGVLSTAGNVVFGGSVDGYLFALDAVTGAVLWSMSVGGSVVAAPITYLSRGQQLVTIAAGNAIFTFGLE